MLEFAMFPPEINSGLMYAGPGAGPMTAASAAWDALADDLYLAAVGYGSTVSDLTSLWLGPSSLSMATAAATFVSWITATAAQAELTAAQATAAVAAYEAAFGMTVPPPVIAANRALLLALVATNFFGQNTPAIMATEAEYVEMWAQDAAAMYGYAGASSAASALTPFTTPLETTNPSGFAGMAAAVTQAAGTSAGTGAQTVAPLSSAALPGFASTMASSTTSTSPISSLTTLTSSSAVTSGTSVVSGAASAASMATSGVSMLGSAGSLMNTFGPATATFAQSFQMSGSVMSTGVGSGSRCVGLTRRRRYSRDRDRGPGGVARPVVGSPGLDLRGAGIQPGSLGVARWSARYNAGRADQSDGPARRSAGESNGESNGAGGRQFTLGCPLQLPPPHGATAGIRRLRHRGSLR